MAPAAARGAVDIEPLPSFKDTPAGERQGLFIRKLRLCSQQMDFSETDKARDKEIKRLNLLEIMDYINTTKGVFNESTFEEITAMISANLFRGLAPNNSPPHAQYDPDEDEPVLEASWPHLQYVYEFLLRFVVSNETDPKVVKRYITQDFLVRLLDLFDSEDPREVGAQPQWEPQPHAQKGRRGAAALSARLAELPTMAATSNALGINFATAHFLAVCSSICPLPPTA